MIIYVSSATSYSIYDREFSSGNITGGQQAQKFNSLLIKGLGKFTSVVSVAALPYKNTRQCSKAREEITEDGVRYICIRNFPNRSIHKALNVFNTICEIYHLRKMDTTTIIICDSINLSASVSSVICRLFFKIRCIAIVTDVPEIMCGYKMGLWMKLCSVCMKKYDAYVLLTQKMNDIVNPKSKPYIIVEGSCDNGNSKQDKVAKSESEKKICLFSGSLGENAGIELMISGFLGAKVPDAELWIYGGGPFADKLKRTCTDNPSIKYGGTVKNNVITELQRHAALLINPRLSTIGYCEYSFPSKLMEYLVSGTAVLTTRLPGIPLDYMDYMYFIDNETEIGFSNAIKATLSKPQNELNKFGMVAREYVLRNKNNVAQAERILELLEQISSGN